jgi:hypothetical protein
MVALPALVGPALVGVVAAQAPTPAWAADGLPPGVPVPSWAKGKRVHFDPAEPPRHPLVQDRYEPQNRSSTQGRASRLQPALTTESLAYFGGPVENEPRLVLVFWGAGWSSAPGLEHELEAMAEGLPGSGYQKILTQYNSFDGPISPVLTDSPVIEKYYDPQAISQEVGWKALKEEALRAMEKIPADTTIDTTYAVMPAPGTPLMHSDFTYGCGGHEKIERYSATSVLEVGEAATIPDTAGGIPCNSTEVLSHEYAESVTDPTGGGWATPEMSEGEIADRCDYLEPQRMADGSLVAALWDDSKNACEVEDNNPEPVPVGPFTDGSLENSTNPSTESETLEAALKPCDREAHYYFEYGTSTTYGNKTAESVIAPTWGVVKEGVTLTGLEHSRQYDWRVVVKTGNGTADGENHEFSIPYYVEVQTGEATVGETPVEFSEASLNGEVQPGGVEADYYFEYGPTEAYGSRTAEASTGSGKTFIKVGAHLAGLVPGALYHYRIVASSSRGATRGQDRTFTTLGGPPAVETLPATSIGYTKAALNAEVDPKDVATKWYFEYGTTTGYGQRTAELPAEGGRGYEEERAIVNGLTPVATYHFRIVASNSYGTTYGADQTFTTGPEPYVETETATAVGYTGATLSGAINPHGTTVEYYFEYGISNSYGQRTSRSPVGSGTTAAQETQVVGGLAENTTYHFRIVATTSYGTTYGADRAFSTGTQPSVQTNASTEILPTGATLNGTINPHETKVEYYFEYGTSPEYGSNTTQTSAGSGSGEVKVTQMITGLAPGATYHCRLVADYAPAKRDGNDVTFTTPALPLLTQTIGPQLTPTETSSPQAPPKTPLPPVIQSARQSTTRWRESNQLARISRSKTPTRTTFSFSLNEQANVSFSFIHIPSRYNGHSCPAGRHGPRQRKSCDRTLARGALVFTGHAGTNSVVFAGRISRRDKLNPGTYELIITATNAAGERSAPVRLRFTIMQA